MPTITKAEFAKDPRAVMERGERDDVTITDGDGTPIMVLMAQREALPNPERDAERERWRAAVREYLDAGRAVDASHDMLYDEPSMDKARDIVNATRDRFANASAALQAMVDEEESRK